MPDIAVQQAQHEQLRRLFVKHGHDIVDEALRPLLTEGTTVHLDDVTRACGLALHRLVDHLTTTPQEYMRVAMPAAASAPTPFPLAGGPQDRGSVS